MTKNSNLQERIIEHSKEKFFTYGFKKITMDELAVDLQMSKKTIYKYFNSKQNLVEAVVEKQIVAVMSAYKEITEKSLDYIERLYKLWQLIGKNYVVFGKTYRDYLRVYHYELWKQVDDVRKTVFDNYLSVLQEGIFIRMVRSDLHKEVILPAYLGALRGVIVAPEMIRDTYPVDEALASISTLIFEGLLTDSGRRELRHLKNKRD